MKTTSCFVCHIYSLGVIMQITINTTNVTVMVDSKPYSLKLTDRHTEAFGVTQDNISVEKQLDDWLEGRSKLKGWLDSNKTPDKITLECVFGKGLGPTAIVYNRVNSEELVLPASLSKFKD